MILGLNNLAPRSYRSILTDVERLRMALRYAWTEHDFRWFTMNLQLLERCLRR